MTVSSLPLVFDAVCDVFAWRLLVIAVPRMITYIVRSLIGSNITGSLIHLPIHFLIFTTMICASSVSLFPRSVIIRNTSRIKKQTVLDPGIRELPSCHLVYTQLFYRYRFLSGIA